MKNTSSFLRRSFGRAALRALTAVAALASLASAHVVSADETCSSPYLARIEGHEEFLYVWTLGVEGLGDGADKLVTVDVKPGSADYAAGRENVDAGEIVT
jgi:selenium-binding protein 1